MARLTTSFRFEAGSIRLDAQSRSNIQQLARALEQGQLVTPFRLGLVPEAHFRFVCPSGTEKRPHVAAFHKWIMTEIQASKAFEGARDLVPVQSEVLA